MNGYSRDRGIILKFWLENMEKHLPFQEKSVIISERICDAQTVGTKEISAWSRVWEDLERG